MLRFQSSPEAFQEWNVCAVDLFVQSRAQCRAFYARLELRTTVTEQCKFQVFLCCWYLILFELSVVHICNWHTSSASWVSHGCVCFSAISKINSAKVYSGFQDTSVELCLRPSSAPQPPRLFSTGEKALNYIFNILNDLCWFGVNVLAHISLLVF